MRLIKRTFKTGSIQLAKFSHKYQTLNKMKPFRDINWIIAKLKLLEMSYCLIKQKLR
jgi:hypothetical protein